MRDRPQKIACILSFRFLPAVFPVPAPEAIPDLVSECSTHCGNGDDQHDCGGKDAFHKEVKGIIGISKAKFAAKTLTIAETIP
ncbi:MAG: hypothetical protein ACLTBF_10145 [Christensenellales bacterium]